MAEYQSKTVYGNAHRRTVSELALGIPAVKDTLDNYAKNFPHLAGVNGTELWMWDNINFAWNLIIAALLSKIQFPINGDTECVFEADGNGYIVMPVLIKSFAPEAAVKIGTTDGGDEFMFETPLDADTWEVILAPFVVDASVPQSLWVSGMADGTLLAYKFKL